MPEEKIHGTPKRNWNITQKVIKIINCYTFGLKATKLLAGKIGGNCLQTNFCPDNFIFALFFRLKEAAVFSFTKFYRQFRLRGKVTATSFVLSVTLLSFIFKFFVSEILPILSLYL